MLLLGNGWTCGAVVKCRHCRVPIRRSTLPAWSIHPYDPAQKVSALRKRWHVSELAAVGVSEHP